MTGFCNFGDRFSKIVTKMEKYIPRFLKLPEHNCFLLGPRGTGKSTYLRNYLPHALWVDLLKPENYRKYKAYPERLEELILGNPGKKDIVIDEIQRVPELLPLVHRVIEMKQGHRFILTGSSARKLKHADANLLGGRAVRMSMYPFILAELGPTAKFEEALKYGLLPVAFASPDKPATLDAYVTLYMEQEVYQESLVRNIGDFARFLEAVSFSHGAVSSQIVTEEYEGTLGTVGNVCEDAISPRLDGKTPCTFTVALHWTLITFV